MRFAAILVAALGLAACKPSLLPGTQIEDTDENRAVYDVLDGYRKAMEARDADKVMGYVSKDFFETGGNEDPADDYGYEQLTTNLRDDLGRTLVLRLDLMLKEIAVNEDTATVTYRYRQRAHVTFPAGDQWVTDTDVNRMTLKREDGVWKITAGI